MRKRPFGRTADGRLVEQVLLESDSAAVAIISLGAVVRDWRIDGPDGSLPMVLGFGSVEDYVLHARSHGAICGRVANRVRDARFTLEGREYRLTPNEGPHQLHGGPGGISNRVWEMDTDGASGAVELRLASPDGDEGWPGAVDFAVSYRLEGPKLVCEMRGVPDRPTPINLVNHNYYNLGGGGAVKDHILWLAASEYTPTREDLIPTGEIAPVEETDLDFRAPREIGDTELDINFVLDAGRDAAMAAARVECPRTGVRLELWTAEPGLQVYDSFGVTVGAKGHDGQSYGPFSGLCLEAQHFPDSLHHPEWPSIVRSADDPYYQRLEVAIGR
jgi:aldose 1-epimerase